VPAPASPTPSPSEPAPSADLAGAEPESTELAAKRGPHRHPPAMRAFVERVRALFAYDPETGELRYRVDIWFGRHRDMLRVRAGDIAGSVFKSNGYRHVRVDGRQYLAHRIAFLIMTGRWPADQLDHIDGIKTNNAWSNLREASNRMNQENQRRVQRSNTHGFLGVTRDGNRWRAKIQVDGHHRHLGVYETPEEAHQAYLKAKRELHVGCTI